MRVLCPYCEREIRATLYGIHRFYEWVFQDILFRWRAAKEIGDRIAGVGDDGKDD